MSSLHDIKTQSLPLFKCAHRLHEERGKTQLPFSLKARTSSYAIMKAARSNMLGAGASNNKVKYSRLAADDEGYIDLQFKKSPPKVPYKAIALAIFLFLIGSLLIIFGALLLSGTIEVEHPDRTIPVIIIGLLVFLPGFYHLRIAYFAAKGYRGYSYEDIPDFGD
ncbi:transmembrane protein 230a isoform X1 [Notolabrus celidotus]|uniref:transmembrane protein 230a isoform X1 n=2 Tax=Notolabrus celidotus TaxID=1203425 RepID=UPI00148F87E7|nr:transmembrane protein 230a isoform X1 [Notolabrus celidotus]